MMRERTRIATGKRLRLAEACVVTATILVLLLGGAYLLKDHAPLLGLAAPVKASGATGDTPFHDHAAKAGIHACGNAFPVMGQRMTQGSQYTVQTRWNEKNPEQHIMQALVGMRFDTPAYTGPAVGYLLAAPMGRSCEAGMIRVTAFEQSCEEVTKTFLSGNAPASQLQGLQNYNIPDGSQVITVPVGRNCVAVSIAHANVPSGRALD